MFRIFGGPRGGNIDSYFCYEHSIDFRYTRLLYVLTMCTSRSIAGVKCSGYSEDPGEKTSKVTYLVNTLYFRYTRLLYPLTM